MRSKRQRVEGFQPKGLFWRAMRSIVTLKGSPGAIALGAAIGVFVAFTPTVGLQMVLAALIATLVGASRPAAIIPAWITNPLTIPPIFALTYWVGSLFWSGPPVADVYARLVTVIKGLEKLSWYAFVEQFKAFFKIGAELFIPLCIGGAIVGCVCAAASYPLVLWAVHSYRRQYERLRQRRARRKSQKGAVNHAKRKR